MRALGAFLALISEGDAPTVKSRLELAVLCGRSFVKISIFFSRVAGLASHLHPSRMPEDLANSYFTGCSVEDVLTSLSKTSDELQSETPRDEHASQPTNNTSATPAGETARDLANEENANIWRWITSKPGVSVGKERKWNHLNIQQVLELPEEPRKEGSTAPGNDGEAALMQTSGGLPEYRPRLYVTESKMWECLAGHAVDYQKLPRFEWLALLGIASVMEDGILQGDLTRLIGQDKRSLPKRTDELSRKGYIEKRPILARGCKTSKLWLKGFAPSTQPQNQPSEATAEAMNDDFPRAALVTDLEPVPWRDHWTGSTIDYAMLGRTIMAVIKEFGVIRYTDLRVKLGVAGHRWQMKVATRICRFFIELGLIQYVTASLGNRLFRDCLKFRRNLTAEDLSAFISGGGSAFRCGNNYDSRKVASKRPEDGAVDDVPTEGWNPDKPLTISVLETILASDTKGISNKGLAFNTIGNCLERHISAVSTAVSMKNSQPAHLRHLQARKDYCRSGRVAAYRFFPNTPMNEGAKSQSRDESDASEPSSSTSAIRDYRFRTVELKPQKRPVKVPEPEAKSGKRSRDDEDKESRKKRKTDTANDVPEEATREDTPVPSQAPDLEPSENGEEVVVAADTPPKTSPTRGRPRGRGRGRGWGRGRGRKSTADGDDYNLKSKGTQWVCEKCGGVWKNDIGLKYHLTKSRTSCNPDYVENPVPRATNRKPRGGKTRQAPRAAYRLGECKVLAQRMWKGDTTLETRQSLQRSALDDGVSDFGNGIQGDTQSRPSENNVSLPATSTGGIIESPLVSSWNAISVPKPSKSTTNASTKKPRHGSLKPSSPAPTTPSRRERSQHASPQVSLAPDHDNTNGPDMNSVYPDLDEIRADVPLTSVEPDDETEVAGVDTKVESSEMTDGITAYQTVQPFEPSATLMDSVVVGEARDVLRVKEIVQYLIRSNGGAFPARISLWHAVVVVWHKAFPRDQIPAYAISQRAVRDLVKRKEISENMFAFRNSAGAISDCFLLVEYGTDPNSPEFQALKALMKSSHPKPYIPPAFTHSTAAEAPSTDENVTHWGTGRGKPVASIEVLDAPIYMHQASQGRRPIPEVDNVDEEDENLRCKPVSTIPRAPYRPSKTFRPAAVPRWSPSVTEWQSINTPTDGVMFLKPNSHLAEEDIPIDPALQESFSAIARDLTAPFGNAHDKDGDTRPGREQPFNVQFTGNAKILQRGDEWPDLENEFFEAGDGSFTLAGLQSDGDGNAHHPQRTWIPSQAGPNGPVYGPHMAQEYPDYLLATPVRAVHRGSAPRGRPRIRRDHMLPRPKLPERTLTRIGEVEGDLPWISDIAPISIGEFTTDEALTVAFVAIRLLLGGSNKAIDWGLIRKLFPDQTIEDLRRFWVRLSKERVHFLASFTEKFQDGFLSAYENDELPPLDYDNIIGYDWQQLIEWGVALRRTNFVKLPVRRNKGTEKDTKRDFVLEDHPEQPRHWHERFFHYQASVFTRFELATSEAAAIKITPDTSPPTPPDTEPTLVEEAISWVRSLCCTATDKCAPEVVKEKLMTLAEDPSSVNKVLDEAVNNLNNRRIITKRIRTRPYMLSRPFQTNLAKFGQEKKFRGASEFKALLDATFRRGEAFRIPFLADDGAQMALMNLYAVGRIGIAGEDVPKVPLGFRPGNYESRKMPKSHLLFGLRATPAEGYLYDEDIEILQRAGSKPPPAANEARGRLLPFWLDFFGDANEEMWARLLGLVCFMLGVRGSMPLPMLARQTRNYLEDYDLRLLVGWCKEVGLVVEDPRTGGLSVTEWWWLVVGRQREWPEEVEVPRERVARARGRPRTGGKGKGKGKAVAGEASAAKVGG